MAEDDALLDRLRGAMRELQASRPADDVPKALGRYEVLQRLGEGAAAVVYEARDRELNRYVALKVLRSAPSAGNPGERFDREARVLAGLSHPNIVAVHDTGEADGRRFLVIEYVAGQPLSNLIGDARRDLRAFVRLMHKVAQGVAFAHERGVVHRDLKPANILITESGEPKVADFGLAHLVGSDTRLTATGSVVGTPAYMAPEQVMASREGIGPATDVHALGVMLFQGVTGKLPYDSDLRPELYLQIHRQPAPSARALNPNVPRDLAAVIDRAMEKEPSRRYRDAGEFAADLERFLQDQPVLAKPVSVWRRARRRLAAHRGFAVAVVLLVLLAVSYVATRRTERAGTLLAEARFILDGAADLPFEERVRAAAPAESLLIAAPDLPETSYLRGRLAQLSGRSAEAEACWRRTLREDPSHTPARFALGWLLLERAILETLGARGQDVPERLARAERTVREALGNDPGSGDVQKAALAAMLDYARSDWEAVRARTRDAVARFKGAPGVDVLHVLLAMTPGTPPTEEMNSLDEAIRLKPRHVLAHLLRASRRKLAGDLAGAEEDYSKALEAAPDCLAARVNRAAVRRLLKRPDDALRDLNAALASHPSSAVARLNRGLVLLDAGEVAAAEADFTEAIRGDPGWENPYVNRARVRLARADVADALADVNRALEIAPGSADALLLRGMISQRDRAWEEAERDFTRALQSRRTVDLLKWRARARAESGRISPAIDDLTEALRLAGPDVELLEERGHLRIRAKDWAGAVEDFTSALALNPSLPEAYMKRGTAQGMLQNAAEMKADFERALKCAPPDWKFRAELEKRLR